MKIHYNSDRTKTVLFIMYPMKSHIVAVSTIATTFLKNGYRVSFVGHFDDDTVTFLKNQRLEYIPTKTVPYGLDYEKALSLYKSIGLNKSDLLRNLITNNDFSIRKYFYDRLLAETTPEIIMMDSFLTTDFLPMTQSLNKRNSLFLFINTFGPAITCYLRLKGITTKRKILVSSEFKYRRTRDLLKNAYLKILLFGNNPRSKVLRKAKEVGMGEFNLTHNFPYGFRMTNIPELILCQREFAVGTEYDNPDQHYIGFLPMIRRNDAMEIGEATILKHLLTNGKVIYVAFGTSNLNNRRKIFQVLNTIISISHVFADFTLIFGNIENHIKKQFSKVPENVFLFGNVPQTFILQKASLFVSHGGFNSIKESICSKVPLVVIPLDRNYDQIDNSLLVVANKIGHNLKWNDTSQRYIEVLSNALNSYESKQNLFKFADLENTQSKRDLAGFIISKGKIIKK